MIVQFIALAVVFAGYAKDAVTAAWLLVVAMAGESACAALTWTIPQDLAPKGAAGTLGGVNNTAGAMAAIAAPAVTGYVAQYYGFQSALALGGAITFVGLLSVIFMLQKLQPLDIDTALTAEVSEHCRLIERVSRRTETGESCTSAIRRYTPKYHRRA